MWSLISLGTSVIFPVLIIAKSSTYFLTDDNTIKELANHINLQNFDNFSRLNSNLAK